jgi:hypothetical protein
VSLWLLRYDSKGIDYLKKNKLIPQNFLRTIRLKNTSKMEKCTTSEQNILINMFEEELVVRIHKDLFIESTNNAR